MFDRLEDTLVRFEELLSMLSEPDVANDPKRFQKLMKEQADLAPIVEAYKEYKVNKQNIEDSLAMLQEENDEELRELAKEELAESKEKVEELEQKLKILLLPKDPNDDKNVIVEIRAGAGGDEAALFAAEIYRMYVHYAESKRWKVETMDVEEIGIGEVCQLHGNWSGRLFLTEIREWCTSCTACAGDRVRWTYPYIHYHRCNHAGGRGSRRTDRYERL